MPRGEHGNHAWAERQHRWSGDRKSISEDGYVKVRVGREHPLGDLNGYSYEHLVVWCAAGRPRPLRGWVLHHKNGVKTDNRLDNLECITRAEHNRLHAHPRDPATGRLVGREHKAFPA
jgi:hypothetical protein